MHGLWLSGLPGDVVVKDYSVEPPPFSACSIALEMKEGGQGCRTCFCLTTCHSVSVHNLSLAVCL